MRAVVVAPRDEKAHRVVHQILRLSTALLQQWSVDAVLELGVVAEMSRNFYT